MINVKNEKRIDSSVRFQEYIMINANFEDYRFVSELFFNLFLFEKRVFGV